MPGSAIYGAIAGGGTGIIGKTQTGGVTSAGATTSIDAGTPATGGVGFTTYYGPMVDYGPMPYQGGRSSVDITTATSGIGAATNNGGQTGS